MAKKTIALAILGFGLAGAVFILKNPVFTPNPEANNSALGNNLVLNQPFVEKLDEKSLKGEESLTDQFTKNLADRIAKENPFGIQTENGQKTIIAPDPEQLATELLAEAAAKFDPASIKPSIKDSDLKISQNNGKEALANYIFAFNQILRESAQKMPANLFKNPEDLTISALGQAAAIYQEAVQKFYKLTVPALALDIHKKEIELLRTKKNILEKIINYQEDPLSAILATEELENLDAQFINLREAIVEFIKTNSLNA